MKTLVLAVTSSVNFVSWLLLGRSAATEAGAAPPWLWALLIATSLGLVVLAAAFPKRRRPRHYQTMRMRA